MSNFLTNEFEIDQQKKRELILKAKTTTLDLKKTLIGFNNRLSGEGSLPTKSVKKDMTRLLPTTVPKIEETNTEEFYQRAIQTELYLHYRILQILVVLSTLELYIVDLLTDEEKNKHINAPFYDLELSSLLSEVIYICKDPENQELFRNELMISTEYFDLLEYLKKNKRWQQ